MNIKQLIKKTIQETGHQPFLFVGSGLSKRYLNTEKWDEYADFRCENREELQHNVSALKIAIAKHFSDIQIDDTNTEIALFKQLGKRSISGIITTNYDEMLEKTFPYFETYVGQEELIFVNIAGIGEIYKIHGSVTDASSLVLTSKDYSDFEERSYL